MSDDKATETQSIRFNYQKSPSYRTIHVDGATASTTPRGYAAITFYNERAVIPRVTARPVVEGGDGPEVTLGEESVIEGLDDVMRQLEATIMLDRETVKDLADLLYRMAESMSAHTNATQEQS